MEQTKLMPSEIILNSLDILKVVGKYIKLDKKGNSWVGLCPFHNDTKPSLSITPQKQLFKCFVCEKKGNLIQFVMEYEKLPFVEALKFIANEYDIEINMKSSTPSVSNEMLTNKEIAFIYHRTLFNPENKHVLDYLYKRGLTDEIIEELQIGYAPKNNWLSTDIQQISNNEHIKNPRLLDAKLVITNNNGDYMDFFRDRIIFPIKDLYDNVIGFSGRTLDPNENIKYLNTPFEKEKVLYNLNSVKNLETDSLYLVEGFFDLITLKLLGFNNVVSLMGVTLSDKQIELLKNQKKIKTLKFCLDNDKAGCNGFINIIKRKVIQYRWLIRCVRPYSEEYKDVNELYLQNADATSLFVSMTISPVVYIASHIDSFTDVKDQVEVVNKLMILINDYGLYEPIEIERDIEQLSDIFDIDPDYLWDKLKKTFYRSIGELRDEIDKLENKLKWLKMEYKRKNNR